MTDASPFDRVVVDRAVEWLVLLQSGSVDEANRESWLQWRAAHPEHERAWLHVEQVNRRLTRGTEGLTAATALDALGEPTDASRRRALKTLAAALMVGGTVAAYRFSPWREWTADIRTTRGERRAARLADGTELQINTSSAVDIRFDELQRTLHLIEGEIAITTAPDPQRPARPFVVETVAGRIHPIGTRFVVRQDDEAVRVSVMAGAVELRPIDRDLVVRVENGETATLSSQGVSDPQSLTGEAAWTDGVLIASDMRLADFIAELSRYRAGHLSCARAVADLRVSGVFPLADPERVLNSLPEVLPIRVQRFTRHWTRIVPAQA